MKNILKNKSISVKIILLLSIISIVFVVSSFIATKNIFSKVFEESLNEKIEIISNGFIPQISLNLSYNFIDTVEELSKELLEIKNISLIKIDSENLVAPLVLTSSITKDTNIKKHTISKTLYDPNTKKEIGSITIVYIDNISNNYISDFYNFIGTIIFIFSFLILLISVYLYKSISPLTSLTKSLNSFDPLNPKLIKLNKYKSNEIKSIATSANIMINKIIEYIKQYDDLNNKLLTKEIHLREAQRIANVGSWEYNVVENDLKLSDEVYRILGIKLSQKLTIDEFLDYIDKNDKINVKRTIDNAIKNGSKFNVKYKIIKNNGFEIYVKSSGKVRKKANGSIKLTAVTIDITKDIKNKRTIEKLAYYDSLTGLPNRSLLKDRVSMQLAQAKRDESSFGVLFLDLDHFKSINDTLGHAVGDKLLVHVATKLKNILRESDTISRIGGDEFVILLSDINSTDDIEKISKKVITTLTTENIINSNKLIITTSIGAAIYPKHGSTLDELITKADTAMYQAKKNGRNRFAIYSENMSETINKTLQIENDLRKSIKNPSDFEVFYQSKINSQNNQISGAEALVRWRHHDKGLIYPDEFIYVAEKSNLIVDIGNIIIQKVIKDLDEFNKIGFKDFKIAINLSAEQFSDKHLISNISKYLKECNVKASQLEFEITETLSMKNIDETLNTLYKIKELGSSIAIDDFGTGYSSLSYLKQFPINTLKIDRHFVMDMTENNDDKIIIETIISMAHTLGFKTVAEGVEKLEHVEALKQMGCNELQGYYFSKAIPKHDFINFLIQNKSI